MRLDPQFTLTAQQEHEAILSQFEQLKTDWTALARRCIAFQQAKYFRAVTDPDTGKPFSNFGLWAKHVFGRSPSTIFAWTRIIKVLEAEVADEDLGAMTRQNAEKLVSLKESGKKLTPEIITDAKAMSAREFRDEVAGPQMVASAPPISRGTLGPFEVSKGLCDRFDLALEVGKWLSQGRLVGTGLTAEEKAIGAMVDEFMARHLTEYQEHQKARAAKKQATPKREVPVEKAA